nr:MAG TPA: hypothetical protein [Caudoviricetes sp.]DAU78917.1 MAG TPA: hypothetical protein [Caudoviricetes sp.]
MMLTKRRGVEIRPSFLLSCDKRRKVMKYD